MTEDPLQQEIDQALSELPEHKAELLRRKFGLKGAPKQEISQIIAESEEGVEDASDESDDALRALMLLGLKRAGGGDSGDNN